MKKTTVHFLESISTPSQWIALCRRLEIDGSVAKQREQFSAFPERVTCRHCIQIRTKQKHHQEKHQMIMTPVTATLLRKALSNIRKPDELEILIQVGKALITTTKTQVITGMKGLKDETFLVTYTKKKQQRSSGVGGRCAVEDYTSHLIVIRERFEELPTNRSIEERKESI